MRLDPQNTPLFNYLYQKSSVYHGKALELREAIQDWLAYIPETFPHYTRHTVQHSDEIILQISKILFFDDDPNKGSIQLSAVEAYILIAAAYLHDAGMVTSNKEKENILQSEDWKIWTTSGGGKKRWEEIIQLRANNRPPDETLRNFLADLQIRFLVAEYIRRYHHIRAMNVISEHQASLGRFAFDDPILSRTIADVCVAHGYNLHELEDRERYPDQRDIRGEKVNVRLMAILLRLGDLLDMTSDRACPLLLNVACPLPADSLAHWTQYRRISHRLSSPDCIEIRADCHTQDEHTILQDWCHWIVNEVQNSSAVAARFTRHKEWNPPQAILNGENATIHIRPASTASYVPSKWTFELDHEVVFQRLVNDVYDHPAVFIRELIQNALDASRSQMYADIIMEGKAPPEYPTQVQKEYRKRYPIDISIECKQITNALSEELEERQIFKINDWGIGMDTEIIERYFLQVGRSYYTTDEFRRKFSFVPTSRFGIGFLSVFAVSDLVIVDTYKPTSPNHDGAIRISLSGPRNYLLREKSQRRKTGTKIEVLLRENIERGQITNLISKWCRRVEFPIVVNDFGTKTIIEAERPEEFISEIPDVTEEGATFRIRSFPINRPGIEGELYVFAHINAGGESWDKLYWARHIYPLKDPRATPPEYVEDLICTHGIAVGALRHWFGHGYSSAMRARLDYRSNTQELNLSRSTIHNRRELTERGDPMVISRWEEILQEHLNGSSYANREDGWKYKQRLVNRFPLHTFWASQPETIPIYLDNKFSKLSLKQIKQFGLITYVIPAGAIHRHSLYGEDTVKEIQISDLDNNAPTISDNDLSFTSDEHITEIFGNRIASNVRWLESGDFAIDWELGINEPEYSPFYMTRFPNSEIIGSGIIRKSSKYFGSYLLLNLNNEFVQWFLRIKLASKEPQSPVTMTHANQTSHLIEECIKYHGGKLHDLSGYLKGWGNIKSLTAELCPPEIELKRKMFVLCRDENVEEDWPS
ncbi:ATP-binding protein [Candidatus Nitronereus thalassa]|uniref:ATP-binding protein n=1 Tax=Candidatus Nitronereus thalassa TaxID=3020898 RepID=A0ABU3K4M1_9BACT|nr:ATP-binding protein [Candidatus Nitronereus thalassa]MDT7041331.1 ATP-binding protein [Candidatus Nitronereus thalassa]